MIIDELISSVFIRAPIWDKRDKRHANRNVVDSMWKEIAKDMQHEETALRKKWKYLREKFASEYSKRPISKSGDAAGSCPPSKWPFFQQLMFLKDIVQTRASSGSIAPIVADPIAPQADSGPTLYVDIDDIDDTASQHSQESTMASVSNPVEEAVRSPPLDTQEPFIIDTPRSPQVAGPSAQTPVSAKRKKKSQEVDYYQRMCAIEEKKLEMLANKEMQKRENAQREDEDLMFLKTLLPHIRKIPENMKLRFQSRIQSVVEEFAYGPYHNRPHTAVYQGYTHSTTPSPVDSIYTSTSYSHTGSTSFDQAQQDKYYS